MLTIYIQIIIPVIIIIVNTCHRALQIFIVIIQRVAEIPSIRTENTYFFDGSDVGEE